MPVSVKKIKISDEVKSVLRRSAVSGTTLLLPNQLDRKLYQDVMKILEQLGGRWDKKAKHHVFPRDVKDVLNEALDEGAVINQKQTYQFFPTPDEVVRLMLIHASIGPRMSVLEPSAGDGAIMRQIGSPSVELWAVEVHPERAARLREDFRNWVVIEGDFMDQADQLPRFDRIVMNPPFTRGQDIKHIQRAINLLEVGGRLVAIAPDSAKIEIAFRPISSHWERLPEGSFSESGTAINTVLIVIDR